MNFDYSDDQKFLKQEVRKYLAAHCPPNAVRDLIASPQPGMDADLWQGIVEQGWLGVAIPEAYGGLGMGYIELCAIAEELGRVCAPVPYASTLYFFAEALLLAGTEEQKCKWLPRIAAGEVIGCFAATEAPGPVGAHSIKAQVTDGLLTGSKAAVIDGAIAQVAVVLATQNGRQGLYLAELDTAERSSVRTIDGGRGAATLSFAGTPVEALSMGNADDYRALLDRAAVLLAFEQLGGADRCLEMARDFALSRYAFGRQIGSFQAIKHKLADMYIKNELARAHAYYGAWALQEGGPELPLAAAAARVAACDAYWYASKENIETHGGMGFTWEADPHLFYRRSRHLALVGGSAREWKQILAGALERKVARA
jgi:alkylation response protein AidB-like acyl-CoA dehydrogenase